MLSSSLLGHSRAHDVLFCKLSLGAIRQQRCRPEAPATTIVRLRPTECGWACVVRRGARCWRPGRGAAPAAGRRSMCAVASPGQGPGGGSGERMGFLTEVLLMTEV